MDRLVQDLRYATRTLIRAPGFTAIAVACLAIGIGANMTVFTAVDTMLIRPLPFTEPDRVVDLSTTQPAQGKEGGFSYPDYVDWSRAEGPFSAIAAYRTRIFNLGAVAEPERLSGARISASLFPVLGFHMALGRGFSAEEENASVVVLSHAVWRRRFAQDPAVLGRVVTIDGAPHTVIGVMEPEIRFPETAEIWLPLDPGDARAHREWRSYSVVARLKPGVTIDQARRQMAVFASALARQYPESNEGWSATLQSYRERFVSEVRPVILVMLGAVGFVMLIACANVANLLLARAAVRQREIAVRLSLGAGRWRIIRQLLTESVLLGMLGGALGLLLGVWGLEGIKQMLPAALPFWMRFDIDRTVLLFTAAVTILTGLLFGVVPALGASAPDLTKALKDGGHAATTGARSGRLRSTLVVAEIALSLVLLIGATLMIKSFVRLQLIDPGFESAGVLTLQTSLQGSRYGDSATIGFYREMLRRVERLPAVAHVGAIGSLPIAMCCDYATYFPEGKSYRKNQGPSMLVNSATPGFFETLGIRLLAGRTFEQRDAAGQEKVVIVNRTLATREWPGVSAVGRRLKIDDPNDSTWFTVIGVVADVKQREMQEPERAQLYFAHAQTAWRGMTMVVKTKTGDPAAVAAAVRAEIRSLDPDLPVSRVATMRKLVDDRMFQPRIYGTMFGVFAVAALVLACVGLYGVMSYSVSQRTHEIGIRMALGAEPGEVLRLVVRQGGRLAATGLLLGLPVALALTRLLRGALYGVSTSDPVTYATLVALLAAVALLATYIPARRATRVDPITALKSE